MTLLQTSLPMKIIVLNNGTLGFVELEMKASGFLDSGCDLTNPNFAAIARVARGSRAFVSRRPRTFRQPFEKCSSITDLRFSMSSAPVRNW